MMLLAVLNVILSGGLAAYYWYAGPWWLGLMWTIPSVLWAYVAGLQVRS